MRVTIIGEGSIAYHVARQTLAKGHTVHAITPGAEAAESFARRLDIVAVAADATLPDTLRALEIERDDVVVALLPEDHDNFIICRVAQDLFGVPRAVALVNDPEHVPLFQQLGVRSVVSAADILGAVIEQEAAFEGLLAHLDLAGTDVHLTRLRITGASPACGRPLSQLGIPEGALIAAVMRRGEVLIPRGTLHLAGDDELLLVCQRDAAPSALRLLLGDA